MMDIAPRPGIVFGTEKACFDTFSVAAKVREVDYEINQASK